MLSNCGNWPSCIPSPHHFFPSQSSNWWESRFWIQNQVRCPFHGDNWLLLYIFWEHFSIFNCDTVSYHSLVTKYSKSVSYWKVLRDRQRYANAVGRKTDLSGRLEEKTGNPCQHPSTALKGREDGSGVFLPEEFLHCFADCLKIKG